MHACGSCADRPARPVAAGAGLLDARQLLVQCDSNALAVIIIVPFMVQPGPPTPTLRPSGTTVVAQYRWRRRRTGLGSAGVGPGGFGKLQYSSDLEG